MKNSAMSLVKNASRSNFKTWIIGKPVEKILRELLKKKTQKNRRPEKLKSEKLGKGTKHQTYK